MNTQEATIEVLQNRIKYLEDRLYMALQVLGEMEKEMQDCSQDFDGEMPAQFSDRVIDVVPMSKVHLPTFLNSRTWKHPQPESTNLHGSRDRLIANAS